MLDPELKDELKNLFRDEFSTIDARFEKIDARFDRVDSRFEDMDKRFESMEESIDSLARSTAEGFRDVDMRFDRLDSKLQNQIDALMTNKADRSELAPIHAQLRNLQPH